MQNRKRDTDVQNRLWYSVGEGEGETDHQPRLDAWDKCSGLVCWEGWDGEGGRRGMGMGNTCKFMADSCQCMTKPTTIL